MIRLNRVIKFKIAADGTSASGKSTAGKIIAKRFKMKFLSSGALYRYCALKIIENGNKYNSISIKQIVRSITLKVKKKNLLTRGSFNVINYCKKAFC